MVQRPRRRTSSSRTRGQRGLLRGRPRGRRYKDVRPQVVYTVRVALLPVARCAPPPGLRLHDCDSVWTTATAIQGQHRRRGDNDDIHKVNVPYRRAPCPTRSHRLPDPIKSRPSSCHQHGRRTRSRSVLAGGLVYPGHGGAYGTGCGDLRERSFGYAPGPGHQPGRAAEQGIKCERHPQRDCPPGYGRNPVMVLLKYNRDEQYEAESMDLIRHRAPPRGAFRRPRRHRGAGEHPDGRRHNAGGRGKAGVRGLFLEGKARGTPGAPSCSLPRRPAGRCGGARLKDKGRALGARRK